jgi:hypothetical protein
MSAAKAKRVKAYQEIVSGIGFAYVLPADAASYKKMVEQMAKAYVGRVWYPLNITKPGTYYYDQARAALAAIGISRPKE